MSFLCLLLEAVAVRPLSMGSRAILMDDYDPAQLALFSNINSRSLALGDSHVKLALTAYEFFSECPISVEEALSRAEERLATPMTIVHAPSIFEAHKKTYRIPDKCPLSYHMMSSSEITDEMIHKLANLMGCSYLDICIDLGFIGVGSPMISVVVWDIDGVWVECAIVAKWDHSTSQIVRWSNVSLSICRKVREMFPMDLIYVYEQIEVLKTLQAMDMTVAERFPTVIHENYRFNGLGIVLLVMHPMMTF